jgi:hypothetical protein
MPSPVTNAMGRDASSPLYLQQEFTKCPRAVLGLFSLGQE